MSEDYIKFYDGMFGIWIPSASILKRRNYEWFARLNNEQIFQGKFILAKYFVLALAPNANGNSKMSVIEGLDEDNEKPNDWVSFWQVPSSTTLPVYGPKPLYIGNNVPQFNF